MIREYRQKRMEPPVTEEDTNPKTQKTRGHAFRFVGLGLEMGLAMGIGVGGGIYLDSKLGTKPLFFWLGFLFGLGAAFKALASVVKSAHKAMKKDEPPSPDKN